MPKKITIETRRWIKNKADEEAARNGCRVDLERGKFVIDWLQTYCYLYEGERAGKPIELMKWQCLDLIFPLFSWVKYSKDFKQEVRRFRKAGLWIPKKSGKSPTLAGINLYMLCGDGEQGQKCFSVALDGKQALIQQEHIVQMVMASAPLALDCEINKTTKQILYRPTNSVSRVVSGDNIQGQEGLNGSIFADELHVLDARLMAVLKYAGASRKEPLFFGVSTAGNNPDGYGKKMFDAGRRVNAGIDNDETFFHRDWSLDNSISEEELTKNIKKYVRQSNPSIGKTVYETELINEFNAAKGSLSTLADFKMYRLNQWQNSTNPWLNMACWQANGKPEFFTARALCNHIHGRNTRIKLDAFGGLDLSRVSDMSAFALAIPMGDGRIILIIRLWMPEAYAKAHAHLAEFMEWAKNGFLTLTQGNTMDYSIVRRDIRRLCKHFNVLQVGYDPMYAEATMQELSDGIINPDTGEILEEGLGFERVIIAQTTAGLAQGTVDFESMVLDGTLIHSNNPCANWQAGHCEVTQDSFGNKRPCKPVSKKGDEQTYKKIDSVAASLLATMLAKRHMDQQRQGMGGIFVL